MRIWTHVTIPTPRESAAHLSMRSLATRLVLVLAGVVVFGFSVTPAVAQQPQPGAPASDVSNIPKPVTDTFDRVRMRNAPNDAQAGHRYIDTWIRQGSYVHHSLELRHMNQRHNNGRYLRAAHRGAWLELLFSCILPFQVTGPYGFTTRTSR